MRTGCFDCYLIPQGKILNAYQGWLNRKSEGACILDDITEPLIQHWDGFSLVF